MSKPRWADMTDDDPIDFEFEIEPTVTKHGIKVTYVPPHLRGPHKSSQPVDISRQRCTPVKSVVNPSINQTGPK